MCEMKFSKEDTNWPEAFMWVGCLGISLFAYKSIA